MKGFIANVYGTPAFFRTDRVRKTKGLAKEIMKALGLTEHHWLLDTLAWITPATITAEGKVIGGYFETDTFAIYELDR